MTCNNDKYLAFLAGLGSMMDSETLKHALQKQIKGISSVSYPKNIRRGFAFIQFTKQKYLDQFLRKGSVMVSQRRLGIMPYRKGRKLNSFKSDFNERRLFVSKLNPRWSDETLFQKFSNYGEIENAYIITDPKSGKSRNFGYVITKKKELADHLNKIRSITYQGTKIQIRKHVKPLDQQNRKCKQHGRRDTNKQSGRKKNINKQHGQPKTTPQKSFKNHLNDSKIKKLTEQHSEQEFSNDSIFSNGDHPTQPYYSTSNQNQNLRSNNRKSVNKQTYQSHFEIFQHKLPYNEDSIIRQYQSEGLLFKTNYQVSFKHRGSYHNQVTAQENEFINNNLSSNMTPAKSAFYSFQNHITMRRNHQPSNINFNRSNQYQMFKVNQSLQNY